MAITSANQLELLQTAEAVAREKMIDPDLVIEAMEDSLARAAKSRYGSEMDIRVRSMIQQNLEGIWLGTFHAMCAQLLRRDATAVGAPGEVRVDDRNRPVWRFV